jgi:hypothetical protein
MWYNEESIAPFFLQHYQYVDRIHLLYDVDTFDRSKDVVSKFPNVRIEDFKFPDMFDSIIKQEKLNDVLNGNTFKGFDWVYCLDADELIWPPNGRDAHGFLENFNHCNVMYAAMWQIYRHVSEKDLDPNIHPVHLQRRHGDHGRSNGTNSAYYKPCIIKPGFKIELKVGNHKYRRNWRIKVAPEHFDGAHWAMADVEMAITRRIRDRKLRYSQRNRLLGMGFQHLHITEEEIRNECDRHSNDPQLF